jgi:hypothetical protein
LPIVDPETLIVKGGILVLASIAMLRLIANEILNFKDELTGKRRRR